MNPPQTIIERSALTALCDSTHALHDAVAAAYDLLLAHYATEHVLLVAISDHLRPYREWYQLRRRGLLAPVDALHVGHQHRRAARRMTAVPDADAALTLVMCQRHKVASMLTLDRQFAAYDIDVQVIDGT